MKAATYCCAHCRGTFPGTPSGHDMMNGAPYCDKCVRPNERTPVERPKDRSAEERLAASALEVVMSVSERNLRYWERGPGTLFQIPRRSVVELMEALEDVYPGIVTRTRQILKEREELDDRG
jgi:hypothetical protein